jgi:hypothetical protein
VAEGYISRAHSAHCSNTTPSAALTPVGPTAAAPAQRCPLLPAFLLTEMLNNHDHRRFSMPILVCVSWFVWLQLPPGCVMRQRAADPGKNHFTFHCTADLLWVEQRQLPVLCSNSGRSFWPGGGGAGTHSFRNLEDFRNLMERKLLNTTRHKARFLIQGRPPPFP